MSIAITVPRLGWSMEEATFLGWLKEPGQPVQAGDPLFTLENEKASQDVESTENGILRIPPDAPQVGDVVKVGALLGYLDGGGASDATTAPSPRQPAASEQATPARAVPARDLAPAAVSPTRDRAAHSVQPPISPRARRRAGQLGIDWSQLKGTGRSGRIIEADVLAAANRVAPSPADRSMEPPPPPGATKPNGNTELSNVRCLIAQRTVESLAVVAHFQLRTEVDITSLLQFRERRSPEIEQAAGVPLTLTDLLLRAQARALRQCPFANALWQDNRIVPLTGCHVGLVVGWPDGFMIPIVREPDRGDLAGLAKNRARLVEAVRAGQVTHEALQSGATSLTDLSLTAVDEWAAVIPPPHSSILAVGRAVPRPFVVQGELTVRPTLKLCLSVDQRVMNTSRAAEFLDRIVAALEDPETLM